jgi:hypothetical protein
MGHVAAPELPILPFVLPMGVPDLQGTDSGPWAHPWRGCEPAGGASIFSHAPFLNFVPHDFEAVVQRC